MGTASSTAQGSASKANSANNFQLLRKVEDPHYGEIKLVRDLKTGEQIYLKEIIFDNRDAYQAELIFYNKRIAVSHPNVVRILGCTGRDQQNFCSGYYKILVFIEVLPKTLADEIDMRFQTGIPFSENDILLVAENLIAALSYFETQNIFHGDIRPENIFATPHSYKLSDPYLNVQKNANALSHAILGTAKTLLAPQLLIQVPKQDFTIECNKFKADVFSLGAVLLSMASLTASDELYDYDRGLFNMPELRERLNSVRKSYSKFTYELIKNMLAIREEDRPDFISLGNRLLPHQEDIRRKIEMPFFGMRAVEEEIAEGGDEFFARAYASSQRQRNADLEFQKKLQRDADQEFQKMVQQQQVVNAMKEQVLETKRKHHESSEKHTPKNIFRQNFQEVAGYEEASESLKQSSRIASVTSLGERQVAEKKKGHGQIFGKTARAPPSIDENVNVLVSRNPSQSNFKINPIHSQKPSFSQEGQTPSNRHQARPPQGFLQQRSQQQTQVQQQVQVQPQAQPQLQSQQQLSSTSQQNQQQFQLQGTSLTKHPQIQIHVHYPNKPGGQAPFDSQRTALATRQVNIQPESRQEIHSYDNQIKPYSAIPAQVQFEPHQSSQVKTYFHNQNQLHSGLPSQTLISKQKSELQYEAQPLVQSEPVKSQIKDDPVFDELEAKIQAALQRSQQTYQIASKPRKEAPPTPVAHENDINMVTEASTIPPQNAYKSNAYGLYDAPLTDIGDFGRNSTSEKAGEIEEIIETLTLPKTPQGVSSSTNYATRFVRKESEGPGGQSQRYGLYELGSANNLDSSAPYSSNLYSPKTQFAYPQQTNFISQYGSQGYGDMGINRNTDSDYVKFDTNGENDYGYSYGVAGNGFVKREGQTIILND